MDELKISKRDQIVISVRIDKDLVDFYDDLAQKTNRSRNDVMGIALEFAKNKIVVDE